MKINDILLVVFLAFSLVQCRTKNLPASEPDQYSVDFGEEHKVILLDSAAAANAIVEDDKDLFFDRVTLTEVSLQMRKVLDCESRNECIQDYKAYLKTDVESFEEEEIQQVSQIFGEINEMLLKVNPELIDRDIILIKTKGRHYGDGVFYTRENKIIIPQNVLDNINNEGFKQTMLHEFFHIFSRYNKATRDELYALIGFEEVKGEIDLGPIGSRKLLNPDGTTDYLIKLEDKLAYPLISSTEDEYKGSKPTFFNYLSFHLYELKPVDNGYDLGAIIPFENAPTFFSQIKDNTDYILHADEIMADNFIYTIFYLANDEKIKDFSPEGMKLIESIGELLKNHES